MKLKKRAFCLAASALSVCAYSASFAQNQMAAPLFDGETLNGWNVSAENPDSFRVEDGAIIAEGPRAHLFYDGEHGTDFAEFELSLKVKTAPGANSGVYFHTQYQAEDWPRKGLEAQVNATHSDFRKTGSLYAVADIRAYDADQFVPALGFDSNAYVVREKAPHDDLTWFNYVIRVEDETVSILVNGDLLVRWKQPEDWSDPDRRIASGTFALQAHDPDSKVYFRDIYVRRLNETASDHDPIRDK